ncbi:uncharacterized protein [Dermacentor albipictus]|uniref:uncharacterized protein isoform X2 n=1 Tax=Dermacentor albipictus TaxID=60249 RepID=UPI0038FC310E
MEAAGTDESGHQRDDNRTAFVFFWLAGIAFGGVLGFACVVRAYSDASVGAGPHPPPMRAPIAPREPGSTIRSPEDSSVPMVGTRPQQRSAILEFNHTVCYTPTCVSLARTLRNSLNPLVDPCDNFQEHVCGRYKSKSDSLLDIFNKRESVGVLDKYNEIALKRLRLGIISVARETSLPLTDARKKAASLVFGCMQRFVRTTTVHAALSDFVKTEQLGVQTVPASVATSLESVLTLQVHLSFTYRLGGLIHVNPSTPGCLAVILDTSTLPDQARMIDHLRSGDLYTYLSVLAIIGGVSQVTAKLLKQAVDLHLEIKAALALATTGSPQTYTTVPAMTTTKANLVVIPGLSSQAFGDAIAAKTPYPRDAAIDLDQRVPSSLGNVFGKITSQDLYLWTSWSVLGELARHVDPWISEQHLNDSLVCVTRVKHIMAVPLAATAFRHSVDTTNFMTKLTDVLVHCFATNASRWLRRPGPVTVVAGFPPSEDTLQKLNKQYDAYPKHVIGRNDFLTDWVQAAKTRKQLINTSAVHFDPSVVDVIVSRDGLVIVPEATSYVLYSSDSPPSFMFGNIGHMIARRFVQRMLLPTARPDAQCVPPDASKAADVFENLLAYQCARHVFTDELQRNASAALWLPMHLRLTPQRQFFAFGCLKDCRKRGLGIEGSCATAALRRLPTFTDAYGCRLERPACNLT